MKLTITGPNPHGGMFHVHRTGCRDLNRQPYASIRLGYEKHEEEHSSVRSVVEGVYADMIDEFGTGDTWVSYLSEFKFFPCTDGLPDDDDDDENLIAGVEYDEDGFEAEGDPMMNDPEAARDNARRAAAALGALAWFTEQGHGDPADPEATLTDLLTDLMHYCDATDLDFGRAAQMARIHHFEETQEENR